MFFPDSEESGSFGWFSKSHPPAEIGGFFIPEFGDPFLKTL